MMKKKRTLSNLFNDVVLRTAGLCLLGCMTILASCDKTDNATDGLDTEDDSALYLLEHPAISVEPFGGGSPATRAALAMEEERLAFNVGEELGNVITLGNSEVEDTPQTRAFDDGTYYRIVIYRLSEWNAGTLKIYAQRLCKTGSADYLADMGDSTKPVYLKRDNYRIFCYSFNKTTTDKMPPLADGAANVPLSDGDDFLSSDIISKSIVDSQFDTSVGLGTITLKHRCCRLIGILTTEGNTTEILASPAPSLSVTSAFTTTGNWSIKNTSFGVTASVSSTKNFSLNKSGNNYTGTILVLPLSGKALAASYTFKPNGTPKNATATNKSITNSATFAAGGSYSFTIKALNAYVITEGVESLKIGSYTWATRNVRWNNTFETNLKIWESGNLRGISQASTANEGVNSDYNSYFMWGNRNAFVNGGSYETGSTWQTSRNPCPSGYRVPTKAELANLITKMIPKGTKVSINGEILAIESTNGFFYGNKARGVVLKDGVNVLILPAAGYRLGTGWGNVGNGGYYWSTMSDKNGVHRLDLYKDGFSFYPGVRTYGFSVRCIKS